MIRVGTSHGQETASNNPWREKKQRISVLKVSPKFFYISLQDLLNVEDFLWVNFQEIIQKICLLRMKSEASRYFTDPVLNEIEKYPLIMSCEKLLAALFTPVNLCMFLKHVFLSLGQIHNSIHFWSF